MPRRRAILVAALLIGGLFPVIGAFAWNQHLAIEKQERESHFIAIHFLAMEASHESEFDGPKSFEELLKPLGGPNSMLAKPFSGGLVYHPHGGSFSLEEPKSRRVSIFRTDRLIATDRRWPRWEFSGQYAKKFPDQEVPPRGYE